MSLSFTRNPEKNLASGPPRAPKQTCNMQLKSTSTFKLTPKLQNDLLNHYLGQVRHFTYGSDTRGGGMLQITCKGLLYGDEKLKLSALALSLQGA